MKTKLLLASLLLAIVVQAQQPSFIADSLDAYIERGLKEWQIPGLSIAIVKDGKVILEKGYGVKEMGGTDKVNEHTLFQIASNSKLFTATILAKLDYEKKLSLDDKVTKYLPWYKLYDANASALVTVKDLLCHRFGTKTFQGDFTFWNSGLSRVEISKRMALLKPNGQFRQDYGYCNNGFLTAGLVAEMVTKKPWEVYVYDSIFMPLGMTETNALTTGMSQMNNVSKAHSNSSGTLQVVPYDNIDNLAPAGSIVSNVHDVSKWLLMQLDSGRANGKRILPWAVLQKTRDINIMTGSRKSSFYPVHMRGYGLGVFGADYNGRMIYFHTGGAFGFVTNTCFVPEEKLGITIMTNNDNQNFFELLRYQILDAYLGVAYTNRSAAVLPDFNKGMEEANAAIDQLKKRAAANAKPKFDINKLVGEYSNSVYGKIKITKTEGKQFKVQFQQHAKLEGYLEFLDGDEMLLTYNHPSYGTFAVKLKLEKNEIKGVDIRATDFVEQDAYSFTKMTN
jgi:CubicO group peptidase (beta-lactamase class C family)